MAGMEIRWKSRILAIIRAIEHRGGATSMIGLMRLRMTREERWENRAGRGSYRKKIERGRTEGDYPL